MYVQVGVPICHSHAYIDACMHVCASAPPCACEELWCGGWSIRRGVCACVCARSASLQCGCVCVRVYASGSPVSVLQVLCSCACKSISGVLSADMFGSDRDLICFFGMRVIPVEPCATVRKLKQIHVLRRGGEMGAITTFMSKAYRVFILLLLALRPPRLRTSRTFNSVKIEFRKARELLEQYQQRL